MRVFQVHEVLAASGLSRLNVFSPAKVSAPSRRARTAPQYGTALHLKGRGTKRLVSLS